MDLGYNCLVYLYRFVVFLEKFYFLKLLEY